MERPAGCMQGAKEAIPCIFQFPAHTTIMSKRDEVTPLLTPCAMLFWPNSSCVTTNNIAIGEGGNGLLICGGKPFCQTSAKNRYFCNVSQQVFSGVVTCTSPKASFPSLKKYSDYM